MFKQTPKRRVMFLHRFIPVLIVLFGVFSLVVLNTENIPVANAAAASTINFQARLMGVGGNIVADGNYNVEFKLYNALSSSGSSQGSCTGDAACLWTETRTSGNVVHVVNGYLTVSLGSVTGFPTTINWNQSLYLTMNIGGTGAPSWDGEMAPRLALTATPFAFQAGQLAQYAGGFNSTLSFQTPTGGNQAFVIQDQGAAGTYNLLTGGTTGSGVQLQTSTPGTQQTGNINISGTEIVGHAIAIGTGSSFTGTIQLSNATNGNTATIQSSTTTASYTVALPTAIGSAGQCVYIGSVASTTETLGYTTCGSGGTFVTLQAGTPGVADHGNLNIDGVGIAATLQAGTFDTATGTGMNIGTSNATSITIAKAGVTTTVNGSLSAAAGLSASGGAVTLNGNAASQLTTTSGALNITSAAAATWSTAAGLLTIQGAGGATLSSGAGTTSSNVTIQSGNASAGVSGNVVIDTGTFTSGTPAINIGTGAHANTIAVGNNVGATGLSLLVGTGNFSLNGVAGSTYTIGAATTTGTLTLGGTAQTGNITLGSSSGVNSVLIGDGAGTTTVNIANSGTADVVNIGAAMTTGSVTIGGTGAQTGTIAIGTGTGVQSLNFGTGGTGAKTVTVGSTASSSSTLIQSGTGNLQIQTQGTGTLGIGNNAVAQSLTIGNVTGATFIKEYVGTGNFLLDGVAGSTYNIGASTTTGSLTLGGTAQTGNITLGSSSGINNVLIGDGAGTTTVNIANSGTADVVNIGAAMTTGSINIGGTGAQTGTIAIGTGTGVQSLNFGTGGTGAKTVIIGSTASTSATTVQAGSNGYSITSSGNSSVTTSGTLTITAGSGSVWSTSAGNLTLQAFSNLTLSPGNNAGGTGTLNVGINSAAVNIGNGSNNLRTIGIGNTAGSQAQTVTVGNSSGTTSVTTIQGSGITETLGTNSDSIQTTTNSTTAFQVQNASGAPIFLVDTSTTSNILTNPGFEVNTTGWAGVTATLTRNVTKGLHYHGQASLTIAVTTAGGGAQVSAFNSAVTPGTYNFSFYALNSTAGALAVAITGGSAPACVLNSTSMSTSGFQRYNCSFTSTTTNVTAIAITSTTTGTFYVDAVELSTGATLQPYGSEGAIQLRGIVNSPVAFQATSNSTSAFQVQNAAGTDNLFIVDTLNNRIGIGTATPGYALDVVGAINSSTDVSIGGVSVCTSTGCAPVSGSTYYIQNGTSQQASSNFNISGTGIAVILQAGTFDTASGAALNIGSTNATSINIGKQSVSNIATTVYGTTVFKPTSGNDSTTAFALQNASNVSMFNLDTTTGNITIGSVTNGVGFSPAGGFVATGTARHAKSIVLTPEYSGAVLDAASDSGGTVNCSTNNNGSMTSGYVSGIAGFSNTTQSFYKWTSNTAGNQCYDVVVQVPVPSDWAAWGAAALNINDYTSDTTNGKIELQVLDTVGTAETNYNYVSLTPGSATTWTNKSAATNTFGGTYAANGTMTIRIRITSPLAGDVRIGNITLNYLSKY